MRASRLIHRRRLAAISCLAACGVLWLAGCQSDSSAGNTSVSRSELLAAFFAAEHGDYARHRPHLLELRYNEMATEPFYFLRGTEALFHRDLSDPSRQWPFSAFAPDKVPRILLQGDTHLENAGTYGPQGAQHAEWNDFDSAGYGPFVWDVVRASAAYAVALKALKTDKENRVQCVRALTQTYVGTLLDPQTPAPPLTPLDSSPVYAARFASAAEAGLAREELADFTTLESGTRLLIRGATDPEDPREALLEAPSVAREAIDGALQTYSSTLFNPLADPSSLSLKDVAFRCGRGVGSLTLIRFYVLVEGATTGQDDDVVLQLKETVPSYLDRLGGAPLLEPEAAKRLVSRTRQLQGAPDSDAWLGYAQLWGIPFTITTVSGYQASVRLHKQLAEYEGKQDALEAFGRDLGRLLGLAHARSQTPEGNPARDSLAASLRGREEAFGAEITQVALDYYDRVQKDWEHFLTLRQERGPTLGMAPAGTPPTGTLPAEVLDPPCP